MNHLDGVSSPKKIARLKISLHIFQYFRHPQFLPVFWVMMLGVGDSFQHSSHKELVMVFALASRSSRVVFFCLGNKKEIMESALLFNFSLEDKDVENL